MQLNFNALPKEEWKSGVELCRRVVHLEAYAQKFDHCVDLYDYAHGQIAALIAADMRSKSIDELQGDIKTRKRMHDWVFCAAEAAAIYVFHFEKYLEYVLAIRHDRGLRTLTSYLDKSKLRVPNDIFLKAFPHHEKIRHAVGHQAEASLKEFDLHAVNGPIQGYGIDRPGGKTLITSHMNGRTYVTTVEGRILTFDLSKENSQVLYRVIEATERAFDEVTALLDAVPSGQLLQPKARP